MDDTWHASFVGRKKRKQNKTQEKAGVHDLFINIIIVSSSSSLPSKALLAINESHEREGEIRYLDL